MTRETNKRRDEGVSFDIPWRLREEMQKSLKRAIELSKTATNKNSTPELGEVFITIILAVSYLESFINYWAYHCLNRGTYSIHLKERKVYKDSVIDKTSNPKTSQYYLLKDKKRSDEIIGIYEKWEEIEQRWSLRDKYNKLVPLLNDINLTAQQKKQLDSLCKLRNRITHSKLYFEESPYICDQPGQGWKTSEPDDFEKKLSGFFKINKDGWSSWHRIFTVSCAQWTHDFSISLVKLIRGKTHYCPGDCFIMDQT